MNADCQIWTFLKFSLSSLSGSTFEFCHVGSLQSDSFIIPPPHSSSSFLLLILILLDAAELVSSFLCMSQVVYSVIPVRHTLKFCLIHSIYIPFVSRSSVVSENIRQFTYQSQTFNWSSAFVVNFMLMENISRAAFVVNLYKNCQFVLRLFSRCFFDINPSCLWYLWMFYKSFSFAAVFWREGGLERRWVGEFVSTGIHSSV